MRRAALVQGLLLLVDDILAQREHHAVDVLRAEAVEHQGLVDRYHIGDQGPRATDRGIHLSGRQESCSGQHQQAAKANEKPDCIVVSTESNAGHDAVLVHHGSPLVSVPDSLPGANAGGAAALEQLLCHKKIPR
ncbi:hypothetical protein GCM10027398_27930 [Azotobacter salinestris]